MKEKTNLQAVKPDEKIGRFAVSVLSRDRVDEALPYEVLVDHNTGVFLVKDSNGNTISSDVNEKIENHTEKVVQRAKEQNIFGPIDLIEVPNKYYPYVVEEKVNFLDGAGITVRDTHNAILSLDITCVNLISGMCSKMTELETEINLKFEINGGNLSGSKVVNITTTVKELNSTPLSVFAEVGDWENIILNIREIIIKRNPSISDNTPVRIVLNSALLAYK